MEKKSKAEFLSIIEDQKKTILKYKSRLHDIVESYKHLLVEKEALETSIKSLTQVTSGCENVAEKNELASGEITDNDALQMLKSSLCALTAEKSRNEAELKADRKKLLQENKELEKSLANKEFNWKLQQEKFEFQIQELRKKITAQQHEREKEQHDHSLMLKELQNLLANERIAKEKLEQQISDLLQNDKVKLPDKKALEYEQCIENLKCELQISKDKLNTSEINCRKISNIFQKLHSEMEELKLQYQSSFDAERQRADKAEEKLNLLTKVKENRIANLENRISELSSIVGNYDKLKHEDQLMIQRLKEKISQLHLDNKETTKVTAEPCNSIINEEQATNISLQDDILNKISLSLAENNFAETKKSYIVSDKLHDNCQKEIMHLKEELEHYKLQAESALKEKYNKTSAALLSDAKEIKDLKSRITQLQDQLKSSKSQMKLNEEYHIKIIHNLEKSIEEIKNQHKNYLTQVEMSHQAQIMDLEHQIQKQRERTLSLLQEKDKEISHLRSSFLSSFINGTKSSEDSSLLPELDINIGEQTEAANILSQMFISNKKEGHILHYVQELSRKDVEISNLRQARLQTESSLRKLQQITALMEEKYSNEVEILKSKIKLLESNINQDGTNVEYLKNVILRFLKCNDPNTKRHMVNAIATVLHFTNNEIQEIKAYIKS